MRFFFKDKYCYTILVFVGFLVYFPILDNGWLDQWDDYWVVKNQYTEGGVNIKNIWCILTKFYHGQYAPFNEYLYLVLYAFSGGYDPFIFHSASMFLHIINACLVFVIIKGLLSANNKVVTGIKIPVISFGVSLFFLIHPFNVESVSWMSASKVLVYTFFYLLAIRTFLIFLQTKKIKYYYLTYFLYVFSFFGKEQAVTFPLLILLIYWFLYCDISNKWIWQIVLPFFITSLLLGIVTMYSQSPYGEFISDRETYSVFERFIYACYSFTEYLCKSIFPFQLLYLYPFLSQPGELIPKWLLLYPAFIMIIIVTQWNYLTKKPFAFGFLFFIIHIVLVLHIISLSRFAVVADRYAYVSTIGIGFIIMYYAYELYNYLTKYKRIIFILLFGLYLGYFAIYSNLRSRDWKDSNSIKKELRDLLKQRPDYEHIKKLMFY